MMTATSSKPLPTPLAMSAAPQSPTPVPVPIRTSQETKSEVASSNQQSALQSRQTSDDSSSPSAKENATLPCPNPTFPSPKLLFECRDLSHAGSSTFFHNADPSTCLSKAVHVVLSTLYRPTRTNPGIPPTRSVRLVIRSMDGVAYTTGSELDNDHKEMHFSLDYIHGITSRTPGREAEEIQGVLVHEMVHAWQWNGSGEAPGGLIEGIADFVRLEAGLSPPHWKREAPGKWDLGYQYTAYFLQWLEDNVGVGSVRKINDALKDHKYVEKVFWKTLFGRDVDSLFDEYKASLKHIDPKDELQKSDMADGEFWTWVKVQKGAEQTIVLKAVWRTRSHTRSDLEVAKDSIGEELQELWSEYLMRQTTIEQQTATREPSSTAVGRESDNDEVAGNEDEDLVLVARDEGR